MAKFKVGDKVCILDGSKIEDYAGNWIDEMKCFIGMIDTIDSVLIREGKPVYGLKHHLYVWDERGLELVRENKFKVGDIVIGNDKNPYSVTAKGIKCEVVKVCDKHYIRVRVLDHLEDFLVCSVYFDLMQSDEITITRYGNKVVAKYGKKVSIAKCSPEDEFDFATGARLAFERLMGIEEKPTFTKDDLKTGMFVLMSDGDLGVVVNDIIIYEKFGYDVISHLDDNLSYHGYSIDVVVIANSFGDAKFTIEHNNTPKIVWRRSTK